MRGRRQGPRAGEREPVRGTAAPGRSLALREMAERARARRSQRARRTRKPPPREPGSDSQRQISARDDVLGFAHAQDVDQLAGVLETAEVRAVVDHILCECFRESGHRYQLLEELVTVPGFTEAFAQDVIDYRTNFGGFQNTRELVDILGMSEAEYVIARRYLTTVSYT